MPFCPTCRTEYRAGFTRCSDCEAALVAEPPDVSEEAKEHPEFRPVKLAVFLTTAEAAMVKEILEQNGIPAFVRGLEDPISVPVRAEQIALFVDERDVDRALEIYAAFFGEVDEEEPQAEE